MRRFLKTTAIVILFINAIGALYGGFGLIYDPGGAWIQMPQSMLEHTPFPNYLIPGIILLVVNGLFSILTLYFVLRKHPMYARYVVAQGVLLAGWIAVQVAMLRIFYAPMHLPFFLMGVFLVVAGIVLSACPKGGLGSKSEN